MEGAIARGCNRASRGFGGLRIIGHVGRVAVIKRYRASLVETEI